MISSPVSCSQTCAVCITRFLVSGEHIVQKKALLERRTKPRPIIMIPLSWTTFLPILIDYPGMVMHTDTSEPCPGTRRKTVGEGPARMYRKKEDAPRVGGREWVGGKGLAHPNLEAAAKILFQIIDLHKCTLWICQYTVYFCSCQEGGRGGGERFRSHARRTCGARTFDTAYELP